MLKAIFNWFVGGKPTEVQPAPKVVPEVAPYKVEPPVQTAPVTTPAPVVVTGEEWKKAEKKPAAKKTTKAPAKPNAEKKPAAIKAPKKPKAKKAEK